MTEQNRQFDDRERQAAGRFRSDLRSLFEPPGPVPQHVDKAILDQARRHAARPRRLIVPLRWASIAAAAVILIAALLHNPQSAIRNPQSISPAAAGRADIDGNGRVDILDALRLARHVESRGPADTKWDLNGDGLIDRRDVDAVAFAAVRLDKGV